MIALVWHKYKPTQAQDFYWSEDCKFSISTAQCDKHAPDTGSHSCSSLPLCPLLSHGCVNFWDSEWSLCTVCWGSSELNTSLSLDCSPSASVTVGFARGAQSPGHEVSLAKKSSSYLQNLDHYVLIPYRYYLSSLAFFLWFLPDYQISTGLSIFLSFVSIPQHSIM